MRKLREFVVILVIVAFAWMQYELFQQNKAIIYKMSVINENQMLILDYVDLIAETQDYSIETYKIVKHD